MNRFTISAHFFFFLLLLVAVWALPHGRFVLVVAKPGAAPSAIMSIIGRAGGSFVEPGRLPWLAVAYSEANGFPSRLMKAGAFLVLNHDLAAGCQQKDS
jgi:hypothetical protein